MSSQLFKAGGPYRIEQSGPNEYTLAIPIPKDEYGKTARECHAEGCSPAYFKVKNGTGLPDQEVAYCPYCRHADEPQEFVTSQQREYAHDIVMEEARGAVDKMISEAFGLGASGKKTIGGGLVSMEISKKPRAKRTVPHPFEEEVRRDIACPHCGLDQAVYGLATWCADCGKDIFLHHVSGELDVVRIMVADVPRRRTELGRRVAAKDLENSLEDVVSIFEAVLRALMRRALIARGESRQAADDYLKKQANAFQNTKRAEEQFRDRLAIRPFSCLGEHERESLDDIFAKRHLITHNLGVVDRKYLERVRTEEQEGRDVTVSEQDVLTAANLSMRVFSTTHAALFPDPGGEKPA
jgi:hypothetical protein